jgi:hypothetical protein
LPLPLPAAGAATGTVVGWIWRWGGWLTFMAGLESDRNDPLYVGGGFQRFSSLRTPGAFLNLDSQARAEPWPLDSPQQQAAPNETSAWR